MRVLMPASADEICLLLSVQMAVPHLVINGFKNVVAIALGTEYSFPQADKVRCHCILAAICCMPGMLALACECRSAWALLLLCGRCAKPLVVCSGSAPTIVVTHCQITESLAAAICYSGSKDHD